MTVPNLSSHFTTGLAMSTASVPAHQINELDRDDAIQILTLKSRPLPSETGGQYLTAQQTDIEGQYLQFNLP